MDYYKDADNQVWAYEEGQPIREGLTPIDNAERDTLLAQRQEADRQAFIDSLVTEELVKQHRDILLMQTDWWAVADRTMTQEQRDYRQALRDITDQSGYPTNVTWPTKPE